MSFRTPQVVIPRLPGQYVGGRWQDGADGDPVSAGVLAALGEGAEAVVDDGQVGGLVDVPSAQESPRGDVPVVA